MKKLNFIKTNHERHWVGNGFPVRSIFNHSEHAAELTPFLLMDYAGPATFQPTNHRRGVGEHPHRGFETVTIVYQGQVEHRDSSGGGGMIGPGDVQWMTAASGIVHDEFHGPDFAKQGGAFEMIQLWVNLPKKDKSAAPAYQTIKNEQIPQTQLPGDSGTIRVIAGKYDHHAGPAHTFTPINVWDVRAKPNAKVMLPVQEGQIAAVFVLKGRLRLESGETVSDASIAVFERNGQDVQFTAEENSTILFLSGEPIDEPIAAYGPFVMNTQEEIRQAFLDFQNGKMGALN